MLISRFLVYPRQRHLSRFAWAKGGNYFVENFRLKRRKMTGKGGKWQKDENFHHNFFRPNDFPPEKIIILSHKTHLKNSLKFTRTEFCLNQPTIPHHPQKCLSSNTVPKTIVSLFPSSLCQPCTTRCLKIWFLLLPKNGVKMYVDISKIR